MRLSQKLNSKVYNEIMPSSSLKIFRQSPQRVPKKSKVESSKSPATSSTVEYRENEMKIQMLSRSLYNQIFREPNSWKPDPDNVYR